jgi:hypothetical protein
MKQSEMGKAFEYAVLNSIHDQLSYAQEVCIVENSSLKVAKDFNINASSEIQRIMNTAANAAIKHILRLEPQLEQPENNIPLYLSLQEDSKGQEGDVRDVLTIRKQNSWEIGISCKHNHDAVKHSRLSKTIDFGDKWMGVPCSQNYFNKINPVFDMLQAEKEKKTLWVDIPDKMTGIYFPILSAFSDELERIISKSSNAPTSLIQYLLGRNDFYKVISIDKRKVTKIQAFNIYGTLNQNSGKTKSIINIPKLQLPTRIIEIRFKEESTNTVIVTCDHGWSINMRIHNASSKVEPSLKFDVKLEGVPPELYTNYEPWDE